MSESTPGASQACLYLAGPMRGYPLFNYPAFDIAATRLRSAGYAVFSPAERDRDVYGADMDTSPTGDLADIAHTGFTMREALAADLAWICANATGVAVLPGWEESRGAQAEVALARALDLPIEQIAHWVAQGHS